MANPLMSNNPQNGGNLLQQFQQFRSTFQGDPKAKVEEMLRSGQMTQDQFNYLQAMATRMQSFFK